MNAFEDICGAAEPSLQNLIDEATRQALLPAAQLARVRSATAALAGFLGRAVSDIPGHQGFVIAQMKRMRKAPSKLSMKTLSNYRGELCALIKAGRGRGPKSPQPHSASWQAFKAELRSPADWAPLSRLAGFASARGIVPPEVDDACVERFIAALETLGEVADPKAHDRRLRRQWNRLRTIHAERGLQELNIEAQARVRWTCAETEFDACFTAEIEAYAVWLADDNPLAENPGRGLRASTIKTIRHQLFKAATALTHAGRPIETIVSLADLVSIDSFKALMAELYKRQGSKRSDALHRLGGSLLYLARDWVKSDEHVVTKLRSIVANLAPREKALGRRTRDRLEAFEDERLLRQLLTLPIQLLKEAKSAKQPRKRAMLSQNAIACELLIYAPLRIENLASLRIDRNLERERDRWLIRLPGSVVKNGDDQRFEIPAEAVGRLNAALRLYSQSGGWLFPGRSESAKRSGSLSGQIKRIVEQRLGVPFHAHLYRSIAVYLQVRGNGAHGLERGRTLLGNRDADTIRRNYSFLADREHLCQAQEEITKQRLSAMRKGR
ncbi:hypothetical protein QO058_18850 [Bosea vestrisii]|uniref:hypothetical protein n=1 Tax=Bosea vestrisii TaxID=151416 RepID=UPI0024DF5709|nr:hypothetical protein [Bosea vestrisii]WID94867.1 hypothetical protein QO058_18850 [Bosea vestrisii]